MIAREYKIRHSNGAVDDICKGTVYDILSEMPYLTHDRYVLPKVVVNSIMEKGIDDAGHSGGCEWQAFTIDQSEYDALRNMFIENGFKSLECPDWVVDKETWQILIFEINHGMPHEEQLDIERRTRKAESNLERALRENDEEMEVKCTLELVGLSDEWTELFNRYNDR